MEIIQERLEREYDLVADHDRAERRCTSVKLTSGEVVVVDNPSAIPPTRAHRGRSRSRIVKATILTPAEYVGDGDGALPEKRGEILKHGVPRVDRVRCHVRIPLAEIVLDFYDKLKSRPAATRSLDYELAGYRRADLVKLDILVNGDAGRRALRDRAPRQGRRLRPRDAVEKLKKLIPRQLFEVPIQAAIGGRIIARETVKAMRKDVLAKCYGGDITRKRKLLEKQKEGKKRMKQVGSVEVPQEAFLAALRLEE